MKKLCGLLCVLSSETKARECCAFVGGSSEVVYQSEFVVGSVKLKKLYCLLCVSSGVKLPGCCAYVGGNSEVALAISLSIFISDNFVEGGAQPKTDVTCPPILTLISSCQTLQLLLLFLGDVAK